MLVLDLVAAGIVALLILFLAVYVVCRYSAEEEDGDAWLPRVLVVLSLSVACYMVLLLPLEMALLQEKPALSLAGTWKLMVASAYALLFVGGPYAFVFYESWSPHQSSVWAQVRPAVGAVVAVNGVFFLSFSALWLWGSRVDPHDDNLTHASPIDYFVATASSVGWVVVFVFAGVGLAAVPVHAVTAFLRRPRPITKVEYELAKAKLYVEVQHLLRRGRQLDAEVGGGHPNPRQRQRMLLFKREVREVELQSECNETAYHLSGSVILRCYVMAALGVINGVVTVLWVLDILLWNVLKIYPLLDCMLLGLDRLLPMLAVLVYAYFALYMMWCTLAGCTAVSGHFFLSLAYPLRVRGTMLNALLFNALLVLCASFAVLHLCAVSFSTYAASTTMQRIFTVTIARMYGVQYVLQYLQYALLSVFVLAVPWLLFCPSCVSVDTSEEDEVDPLV
jgi:LMBR1 domain-containing protein 1